MYCAVFAMVMLELLFHGHPLRLGGFRHGGAGGGYDVLIPQRSKSAIELMYKV